MNNRGAPATPAANGKPPRAQPSREESVAVGKEARRHASLQSHRDLPADASRDPVGLILGQDQSRVPELVPVRHGRMLISPFTFFRGAALPMAADLAGAASSGLRVQLCGDAHLSNFGAFGSPERRLVFDVNDFDETLPGPFEWDVKRLVASMAVAGRDNGLPAKRRRTVELATTSAYRTAMHDFAAMPLLDVWYSRFDVEDAVNQFRSSMPKKALRNTEAQMEKARTRDSTQAVAKLTTVVDGRRRIRSDPPLIVPIEELASELDIAGVYTFIHGLINRYASTLPPDRRSLVDRYTLTRVARKVVGVGSVGTESWIMLTEPDDGLDPLLLQAKQANRSVLADYLGESRYTNQGERVVVGQRLMQAATDIFLGWTRAIPPARPAADYYVRQLRDWKYAVPIERLDESSMATYARMCGWTLARAHARTGDRIAIAAYLGNSDKFDQALADFAESYADRTEKDYAALADAVKSGRTSAVAGV
jgi:uncharacterized protein (DUF2252 family)